MKFYLPYFVTTWMAVTLSSAAGAFNVGIISIIPNNLPIGVALPFAGAALDVAVSDANRQYSGSLNVSVTLLYNKEDRICDNTDANAPLLLAEYYNTKALNRCVAVVVSGCGGLAIAPFLAKEWDVMAFSNSIVSTTSFNNTAAPTSVGMAGSVEDIALALMELLRYFKWFHVTQLMDYGVESEIYGLIFQAINVLAGTDRFAAFRLDGIRFNITNSQSVKNVVQLASGRSRAFLILAHAIVVIRLLRSMANNLIKSGDYVFIVIQPTQQRVYGPASLFNHPAPEDFPFFRSVLYLTTYALAGSESDNLNDVLQKREKSYGTILENGTLPLDLYGIRETYNSVQLFTALVNQSVALNNSQPAPVVCGGRQLQSLMKNQTFNFPSGQVYVDAAGYRHIELVLYTFHLKEQTMQPVARYDSTNESYVWLPNVTLDWPGESVPLDVPVCGYSGDEGQCALQVTFMGRIVTPAAICIGFLLLFIICCCFIYRKQHGYTDDKWWLLSDDALTNLAARLVAYVSAYNNRPTRDQVEERQRKEGTTLPARSQAHIVRQFTI